MPTFLVQLTRSGPAWVAGAPAEEQAEWAPHAAYMDRLVRDGVVLLGGPLADEHRVVLVVRAASADEVRAVLAGDPWSGSHLVVEAVEPWSVRLDGLSR